MVTFWAGGGVVGVGVGDDYKALGATHSIDQREMEALCMAIGLPYLLPKNEDRLIHAMESGGPRFVHLRKGGW